MALEKQIIVEKQIAMAKDAQEVFQLARMEAVRFKHEHLGTEHLLLGIARQQRSFGRLILDSFNLDLRSIRLEVEQIVRSGPDDVSSECLPVTPPGNKVIEYAAEEAAKLEQLNVGTSHLLLGICMVPDCTAAQVLRRLHVKAQAVRKRTLAFVIMFPTVPEQKLPVSLGLMKLRLAIKDYECALPDDCVIERAAGIIGKVQLFVRDLYEDS